METRRSFMSNNSFIHRFITGNIQLEIETVFDSFNV